jgi:hypothetical protein
MDVFIERRRAVVDGVEITGTDSETKDGAVITVCKGDSDGNTDLFLFSKKRLVRLEIDDEVEEVDGADFERLCKAI